MPAEASSSAQSAFHPSLPHRTTAEKSSQKSEPSAPASSRHPNGTSKQKTRDAILNPGTIKINVQGAFIVDDDAPTPCRVASRSPDGAASNTNGSTSRVNGERDEYFTYQHDTSDIRLPNHTAIVSHIAVDIGGSLAKLVYFSRNPKGSEPGGRLHFLKFETDRIAECMDLMRELQVKHQKQNGSELCVMATGGGAFKYYDQIRTALGVEVLREDEMECLIIGLDFFIQEIPSEVFTHNATPSPSSPAMDFLPPRTDIYPYLLVNIGSGVSMIKVSGPREYERIGGTSLGGGTLWGLLSLITGARNFDDMLAMAEKGDNTAVDMLVGDIYGTGYAKIGLKSDTIASSFGKVYKMKREAERAAEDGTGLGSKDVGIATDGEEEDGKTTFRHEDISRSLLYAVSYNIGQIAYLQSSVHSLEHIYFGGSFIRGHRQTMNTLSYAINYWSKGTKQAYFLRHEGYLGAVGAFLKRQPRNWGRRNSSEGLA